MKICSWSSDETTLNLLLLCTNGRRLVAIDLWLHIISVMPITPFTVDTWNLQTLAAKLSLGLKILFNHENAFHSRVILHKTVNCHIAFFFYTLSHNWRQFKSCVNVGTPYIYICTYIIIGICLVFWFIY